MTTALFFIVFMVYMDVVHIYILLLLYSWSAALTMVLLPSSVISYYCTTNTKCTFGNQPHRHKRSHHAAFVQSAIFCIAALTSFLSTHSLPDGSQFSHGFLACVITVLFSSIVALMLTVDWWRGFPSAGLSATLKALIISSFVMTIVIIIGAAIYKALEGWTFDQAVNFCIVSFATIGM